MPRYSEERKAAVLNKLLPPHNRSIPEVAGEEGISEGTLYNWRQQAKEQGAPVPGSGKQSEDWSAAAKFAVVVETASLSEAQLSAYCREKGLYPEQVKAWKAACVNGAVTDAERRQQEREQSRRDKQRIKALEKELRRKEKALAETAALLALRKKFERPLGGRRGRLTSLPERHKLIGYIDEAVCAGARKARACQEVGVSLRTVQRWTKDGEVKADQRPQAIRPDPANKLTAQERERILTVCNDPEFASLPPSQIVPKLADRGEYIACESSFYRVLNTAGQLHHRGRARAPKKTKAPTTHVADGPNQVWSWDISWMPSRVRGLFWYLYLIVDIYSRKIVGWEVHEREAGELGAPLVERAVLAERCFRQPLVLHADNGSPMKSQTLRVKLADLGISPSYSRPRVSNDNAFSESLFRTLKYCPAWPSQGFATLEEARTWVLKFVDWYNNRHCHSALKFITPAQRHRGEDEPILKQRERIYEQAKACNPQRWSGKTRNWCAVGPTALNPERQPQAA
ncbi:IS3 family transposase [Thiohalophilus sp.]|uniref:IS3 family transposase n=1 Tax=Thiohalophilus sp. TaxID=3028392 RepID=UPI002ACF0199|nr:IS3 family transposase [Thiohalophilus sp.]MDZ7803166.1 IS3 family transposase [Thiohalophilus sp.]MDZ7805365.1 IS3 family transposase [Thiohalophilus sp.]